MTTKGKKSDKTSSSASKRIARFAWQGWSVRVPASWNPVLLNGKWGQGLATLADLDHPRLELQWSAYSPRRPPSLEKVDRAQRKKLKRGQVERTTGWRLDRAFDDSLLIRVADEELRFLLRSSRSHRVLMARFAIVELPAARKIVREVLTSLSDVSDREPVPWCVYDFAFAVPADFVLTEQKALAGSTRFVFSRQTREQLIYWRVSAAARCLEQNTAQVWFDKLSKGERRFYRFEHDRGSVRGHEIEIRRGRLTGWRWVRHRGRRRWAGAVWHCPQTDRLFEVAQRGKSADETSFEAALKTVLCHEE